MGFKNSLGHILGHTTKMVKGDLIAALKNNVLNVSFEQYLVLLILKVTEFSSQQNIARILNKDKSIILRHIDDLIEKEYVTKVKWDTDKRWKKLSLTESGHEILEKIRKIVEEVEQQLTEGIDKESLETAIAVLRKIQANSNSDICYESSE